MDIFDFFFLTSGLSLFLFGMQRSEKALKLIAGGGLRLLIEKLTRVRIVAVVVGLVLTLLSQSSSATTVMLVSFASAGLVTMTQSLGVILGADIGTTVTVQLFAWNVTRFAPLMVSVGYLIYSIAAKRRHRTIGQLILGFGLVLMGMTMMSDAVKPLRDTPFFINLLGSGTSPYQVLLISALFTAIIQSSAATIAIVISLAASASHPFPLVNAVGAVLGANVGTCATALLASLRSDTEGKRVAWAHILFKVAGAALFLPFLYPLARLATASAPGAIARQIANVHTIYNIVMALVFLPFLPQFSRLVTFLVKPGNGHDKRYRVEFIGQDYSETPSLALAQAAREITRMGQITRTMFGALPAVLAAHNTDEIDRIKKEDDLVDFLNREIGLYIARLLQEEMDESQSHRQASLLTVSALIEQTADLVATDFCANARKLFSRGMRFSPEGQQDIVNLHSRAVQTLGSALDAFAEDSHDAARAISSSKTESDRQAETLVERHFKRLKAGLPETRETTAIHLDILEDLRRVNSNACKIAEMVLRRGSDNPQDKSATESEPQEEHRAHNSF